ncbi:MAG: EamA family transporter [Nitriliruptorales bacterium]|nr:EamA family transporter [Nitriliruptorales bacterium]
MSIFLALTAAVSWGTSDFLGGLAGRRAGDDSVLSILFVTQAMGFVPTLIAALLVAGEVTSGDVLIGAVAGLVGMAGVAALYRGLRIGKMGVVAPITGAVAAAIPVVASVVQGEIPSVLTWAGIALALLAIVLVSADRTTSEEPATGNMPPGLAEAIGAGLGFGLIFLLLDLTTPGSGLWPLIVLRGIGTVLVALAAVVVGQRLTAPVGTGRTLVGVALFDSLATITYLFATREGLLAVVAVIASLYPVATVVWARVAIDEQLARHQQGGLVLALGAVALIGLG